MAMTGPDALNLQARLKLPDLSPEEQLSLANEFSQAIASGIPFAYIDRDALTQGEAQLIAADITSNNQHLQQNAIYAIHRLQSELAEGSGTSGMSLTQLQAIGINTDEI